MISAKDARSMTDNNIYNRELKEIEKMIEEACNEGCGFITKEGYIHPETKRRLIKLGFDVYYREETFWGSEETWISW